MTDPMKNPSVEPSGEPHTEYVRRLAAWQAAQTQYDRQHRSLGIAKLVLGGLILVAIGLALGAKVISVFWVLAPLSAISILAVLHEKVIKSRERCSRTVAFYERALARIENRWMGTGEGGTRFLDASHPYARDLDLFGDGSFSSYFARPGRERLQETLTKWLLAPAPPRRCPCPQ